MNKHWTVCVFLLGSICLPGGKATANNTDLDNRTIELDLSWNHVWCDKKYPKLCSRKSHRISTSFYFLGAEVYYYVSILPGGSGYGVVVSKNGGSGSYIDESKSKFGFEYLPRPGGGKFRITSIDGKKMFSSDMRFDIDFSPDGCDVNSKSYKLNQTAVPVRLSISDFMALCNLKLGRPSSE